MGKQRSKPETFACPFCGAPYRDAIPPGTVRVKCLYCGGSVLVPLDFGGLVRRCPNHPDSLAIGLCNDCGRNYCSRCLHPYGVTADSTRLRLYLCSDCLRARQNKKTKGLFCIGGIIFLFGLAFVWFISPTVSLIGVIFSLLLVLLFSVPFIVYGRYEMSHVGKVPTLNDEIEARKEIVKGKTTTSVGKMYDRLLLDYVTRYGDITGKWMLTAIIDDYLKNGLTRKEAVKRVAEDQGYL